MTSSTENPLARIQAHHLEDLRSSGLTDETISASGIYSEQNHFALAAMLGRDYSKRRGSGLVFPFREHNGTYNGYKRVKPTIPRNDRNGKPVKYESPSGLKNRAYFPPDVTQCLNDSSVEIVVVEGEKKALAVQQSGIPCIGLVGVFGWKQGRKADRLIPDIELINWSGRRVYIVFDSDRDGNENVRDAESRLAAQLANRGANVKIVQLPDGADGAKCGADDFLSSHGLTEFRRLLDSAVDPEPTTEPVKIPAKDLDPMETADAFQKTHKRQRNADCKTLRFWHGEYYVWNGRSYARTTLDEVKAAINLFIDPQAFQITRSVTSNIEAALKSHCIVSSYAEMPRWIDSNEKPPFPAKEVLATKSSLVHLPSLVSGKSDFQLPPTPRLWSTNSLNYEFNIDASRPGKWLSFLSEIWPEDPDCIAALQEWFGYSLLPDTSQQKMLMMVGPRRSGKGTIARVLREMIGPENVAGPTLGSLGTNFGLWPLLGKTAAIISDARLSGRTDSTIVTERLLSISGEDALTIDRKNLQPITTKLMARFTIMTNELPRMNDSSGALSGRMIVLPMIHSFYGREDPKLTDKLLEELPGILLWAIDGWSRLTSRGHFVQPETGQEQLREMEDLSSPVSAFVRERCVVGPTEEVGRAELFDVWKEWCDEQGKHHAGDSGTFGRNLRAAIPFIRDTQPRTPEGGRHRRYRGISVKW